MKKLLICAVCAALAAASLALFPVRGEEKLYGSVIRLHVIASSDDPEDQRVKLRVRDGVLSVLEKRLEGVTGADEAESAVRSSVPDIEAAARAVLRSEGSEQDAAVTLSRERYPERQYDNFALPAGEYKSLRVKIGGGEGKNWWCILFPSFCRASAGEAEDGFLAAGFSPDQYGVIKKDAGVKYRVRFRILEILSGVFGFDC